MPLEQHGGSLLDVYSEERLALEDLAVSDVIYQGCPIKEPTCHYNAFGGS